MSNSYREKAETVVDKFKQNLDVKIRSQISPNEYETLTQLISGAIAEELLQNANEIDVVLRKIRKAVEKPELGL